MKRPLLVITAAGGSLCCGYISIDALNRNGDAAAIVTGVNNPDEMLDAKIIKVSAAAVELGVEPEMTGRQALAIFTDAGVDQPT